MRDPNAIASEVEEAVTRLREALATIRFGSVEFIIHEGRVAQIDRTTGSLRAYQWKE